MTSSWPRLASETTRCDRNGRELSSWGEASVKRSTISSGPGWTLTLTARSRVSTRVVVAPKSAAAGRIVTGSAKLVPATIS